MGLDSENYSVVFGYNRLVKETFHIYTRVSTSVQEEDGTSLDTQLELGIERSKKLDMKPRVWNEGSQSSSRDDLSNRPVLTELLQEVQEGSVKHLYVWNTDRLSRNIQTWGLIRLLLIKNDVHLHTPTGEMILSDPQTNLMLGIMSEFSQYDNLIRTERFRLGKLQRIKDGFWKGGPPPYGYRLRDGHLEVDDFESKWVIKIHEMYRDGHTVDEIKDTLMKNGVMTRRDNPVWSLGSINSLLSNTHYDGYWYYTDKKSDQTVRVSCPRICPPELIQGVKSSWDKRRYKKGSNRRTKTGVTKYTYLLSKILKCGHCGSYYYGNYRHGRQSNYYHCGNKTNKYRDKGTENEKVCGSKRNVRIDNTEKVVWDLVKDVLASSHLYKETIKTGVMGTEQSLKGSKDQSIKITKKIDKLQADVQKVTDTIVDLTTQNLLSKDRDLKRVIKRLEETRNQKEVEIRKLTTDLEEIESAGKWVDWLKVWKNRMNDLDKFTPEERHEFLSGIVSEVVVTEHDKQEHKLEVFFRFPYVGDKLVYVDPNKKSKGYKIKNGRKVKSTRYDLLKKFTS